MVNSAHLFASLDRQSRKEKNAHTHAKTINSNNNNNSKCEQRD